MTQEFLKNLQVQGTALPDVVIEAILREHRRSLEAAAADPGAKGESGGKLFTQEEVNRIVSERLAREREKQPKGDEREEALKAREARLECKEYVAVKQYVPQLVDVLDTTDAAKFKALADALADTIPGVNLGKIPPDFSPTAGTRITNPWVPDDDAERIAEAFRPQL